MIEGSARLTERKFVALRKSRRRWSSVGDLEAIAGVKVSTNNGGDADGRPI